MLPLQTQTSRKCASKYCTTQKSNRQVRVGSDEMTASSEQLLCWSLSSNVFIPCPEQTLHLSIFLSLLPFQPVVAVLIHAILHEEDCKLPYQIKKIKNQAHVYLNQPRLLTWDVLTMDVVRFGWWDVLTHGDVLTNITGTFWRKQTGTFWQVGRFDRLPNGLGSEKFINTIR